MGYCYADIDQNPLEPYEIYDDTPKVLQGNDCHIN